MMNLRGNVPLTKVNHMIDREGVVMALANNAMPHLRAGWAALN